MILVLINSSSLNHEPLHNNITWQQQCAQINILGGNRNDRHDGHAHVGLAYASAQCCDGWGVLTGLFSWNKMRNHGIRAGVMFPMLTTGMFVSEILGREIGTALTSNRSTEQQNIASEGIRGAMFGSAVQFTQYHTQNCWQRTLLGNPAFPPSRCFRFYLVYSGMFAAAFSAIEWAWPSIGCRCHE